MANPRQKPVDLWLAIGGVAVGILLFLLPRSPGAIIGSLVVMALLLLHPIWNFWWIEDATWRRLTTLALLVVALACVGAFVWPMPEGSRATLLSLDLAALWAKLGAINQRWIDRGIGVLSLALLTVVWRWMKNVSRSRKVRRLSKIDGMPKGFIDYKLDVERAITTMPAILMKLGAVIGEVGPMLEKRTVQLSRLQGASAAKQLAVLAAASSSLDRYSDRAERIRSIFARTGEMLSDGLAGWFQWIEVSRPSKAAMGTFPGSMAHFNGVIETSNAQARVYIDVLRRTKGAARILDMALDRHIGLMEEILTTNVSIAGACGAALKVFNSLD